MLMNVAKGGKSLGLTAAVCAIGFLGLGGCATGPQQVNKSGYPPFWAQAQIVSASRSFSGVAKFSQYDQGVHMVVDVTRGLPPGTYAIHIHQVGRCDVPGFETAGAHWNPKSREHGTLNRRGPHAGDIPNIIIPTSSQGHQHLLKGARIGTGRTPMLDADGAAIVIHALPDDYRTDPSGSSGARIACGVIELTDP
jgi:Cu-Zn family superoxide dismutase